MCLSFWCGLFGAILSPGNPLLLLGYVWCMSSRRLTLRVALVLTYAVYANGAVMVAYGQQWRRRHGRLRIAGEALMT